MLATVCLAAIVTTGCQFDHGQQAAVEPHYGQLEQACFGYEPTVWRTMPGDCEQAVRVIPNEVIQLPAAAPTPAAARQLRRRPSSHPARCRWSRCRNPDRKVRKCRASSVTWDLPSNRQPRPTRRPAEPAPAEAAKEPAPTEPVIPPAESAPAQPAAPEPAPAEPAVEPKTVEPNSNTPAPAPAETPKRRKLTHPRATRRRQPSQRNHRCRPNPSPRCRCRQVRTPVTPVAQRHVRRVPRMSPPASCSAQWSRRLEQDSGHEQTCSHSEWPKRTGRSAWPGSSATEI